MKQGLSFKEIGDIYGLKRRSMSCVIIRLGIRNYYTYKQEPWKKYILTDEDNIELIEIPYTYKTFSDIGNVLKQILIDGKSTEIIDIPKRMNYE